VRFRLGRQESTHQKKRKQGHKGSRAATADTGTSSFTPDSAPPDVTFRIDARVIAQTATNPLLASLCAWIPGVTTTSAGMTFKAPVDVSEISKMAPITTVTMSTRDRTPSFPEDDAEGCALIEDGMSVAKMTAYISWSLAQDLANLELTPSFNHDQTVEGGGGGLHDGGVGG
jgi:hypothetical protein